LPNEVITAPAMPVSQEAPHLRRVLGRGDLVLLFVVAIVNLNVVPTIAANGGVTVWLWFLALLFFFWPQGIAVIELAHRYPGEGGVYLWAKQVFGDFHGFLSGWCYWTNNIFYVPTVLLTSWASPFTSPVHAPAPWPTIRGLLSAPRWCCSSFW
jgi:amino acid transporter